MNTDVFNHKSPITNHKSPMQYPFPMSVVFDPKAYEQMSDGALMRIAMDRAELTPEALSALEAQLAARGLRPADVSAFASTYRAEVAAEEARHDKGTKEWRLGWGLSSGTGRRFYGKRDLVEMRARQQYQATLWFTVMWVPLIPLGTYIVHRATVSWWQPAADVRPLRQVPLDWQQVGETWAVAAVAVAAVYFLGYKLLWTWWLLH